MLFMLTSDYCELVILTEPQPLGLNKYPRSSGVAMLGCPADICPIISLIMHPSLITGSTRQEASLGSSEDILHLHSSSQTHSLLELVIQKGLPQLGGVKSHIYLNAVFSLAGKEISTRQSLVKEQKMSILLKVSFLFQSISFSMYK